MCQVTECEHGNPWGGKCVKCDLVKWVLTDEQRKRLDQREVVLLTKEQSAALKLLQEGNLA